MKNRTAQNSERTHLMRRLRQSIEKLLEHKRAVPDTAKFEGMRKFNILNLFTILPYAANAVYAHRSVGPCLSVCADDLREWMEKN